MPGTFARFIVNRRKFVLSRERGRRGRDPIVLMDAFVIRAMLVPAFMRLAGEANWWAPPAPRRIQ